MVRLLQLVLVMVQLLWLLRLELDRLAVRLGGFLGFLEILSLVLVFKLLLRLAVLQLKRLCWALWSRCFVLSACAGLELASAAGRAVCTQPLCGGCCVC